MKLHRNSQKRYYDKSYIYFITIKTYNNFSYFKEPIFCNLLIEEIKICKKLKKFDLYGFCILYNHVHLLLQPVKEYNISKVMQFLKRHFTRDVNYIMNHSSEGDIGQCRLPTEEQDMIKEFNIKVKKLKKQFIKKYGSNQTLITKFKWQKSFYDHIIRDEQDLENHYNYTVYNFQKHNLPNDWQYTSLNYEEIIK